MSRPDKCKSSSTQLFYEVSIIHFKAPLSIFSRRRRQLFYWPQNYDERFWTWKLCKSKSTSLGDLLNTILSIYCFLWTFFLLSPQHSVTLWSSLRFTKCRRFILQQNVCSTAWLWVIFVLALLFSRFLLRCWWESQVETGALFTSLWVFFNYTFCGFSFEIATAISVKRLLALLMGLDTDTQKL